MARSSKQARFVVAAGVVLALLGAALPSTWAGAQTVGSSQSAFRIRSGDTEGLNSDTGWAAATNTPATADMERVFRIRFEVSQSSSATGVYELRYRRNGGAWIEPPAVVDDSAARAVAEVEAWSSRQYVHGDPTTNLLVGSTLPFVPGAGLETSTSSSRSLSSQHTEFEWAVKIRKFHEGGVNQAGDTFEFRVVRSDGTALATYAAPAVVTLVHPPGLIGGTYIENPQRIGPFRDGNGNLYTVVEPTEFDPQMMMLKSTDGGRTWNEVDRTTRPVTRDLESVDIRQAGDLLHIAHHPGGRAVYHTFRMSSSPSAPDTWAIRDELVDSGFSETEQAIALEVLSDGRVTIFYSGASAISFRTRAVAGGWTPRRSVDTQTGSWHWVTTVRADAGPNLDRIHVFAFNESSTSAFHYTLAPNGVLSARTLVASLASGSANRQPILPPVFWHDGQDRVIVAYKKADDHLYSRVLTGSTFGVETTASDQPVDKNRGASRQPAADLVRNAGTAHLLYGDSTTFDLWRDQAPVSTGGWATDVEVLDNVRVNWVRGNVFTHTAVNGGATVYGFVYEDHDATPAGFATGYIRYGEVVLDGGGGPTNLPPTVNAGPDQNVTLPSTATLPGSVTDDGQPVGTLTSQWSLQSGPAPVTFADPSAAQTTATFTTPGTYVLTLTGNDTDLTTSDSLTIVVTSGGSTTGTVDVRINAGADDVEQLPSGAVDATSGDLELVFDGGGNQTVALRFPGVAIPPGATVTSAWVQFQVDEAMSVSTSLAIQAHTSDDSPALPTSSGSIGALPRTTAAVAWSPPGWPTVGVAGPDQRTPNLASVVQAIVGRPGWDGSGALTLIVTGTGERVAEAREGGVASAPLLHVEYTTSGGGPTNQAPVVNAGPDRSTAVTTPLALDASVSDDGLPNPPAALAVSWSQLSGPGTMTFGDASAIDTTATFPAAGTYVLQLHATDSALSASDTVTVTVTSGSGSTTISLRVATGTDDAEEAAGGGVSTTSGDLELVLDASLQTVGMRFAGLTIPAGATITSAWVQFETDKVRTAAAQLTIHGQAADSAPTFTTTARSISTRPRTSASVSWAPPAWTTVGEAGAGQRTPELAAVLQEIVSRPGWSSGNAVVLVVTGTGVRVARSYNGRAAGAPVLHVTYTMG